MRDGCACASGVDIVFEKLEEMGIETAIESDKKMHKRVKKGLDEYIKERFYAMLGDVTLDTSPETAALLKMF